jgi:hypothetical protein
MMGEHRNARGKKRRRSSEMGEDNFDIGKHTSVASYDEMSSCFECFIWGLEGDSDVKPSKGNMWIPL